MAGTESQKLPRLRGCACRLLSVRQSLFVGRESIRREFRSILTLPRRLLPSISSMILVLPLFFYGPDVRAATESAFYLWYGNTEQAGLEPLEVWNPGTGYSSFQDAVDALVPVIASICNNYTINFSNGVSCTYQYVGDYPRSSYISQYLPKNSEVIAVRLYQILLPLYGTCTNGYTELRGDLCGGAIREKVRNIPPQQCPITPLQPLPDDPCTQSLEAGLGVDVNGACAAGLTPEMQQEAQCLDNKITSLGIPYPGPTATIRTPAYQAHLREIWEKLRELNNLKDPAVIQACAGRKTEIEAHKFSHGLTDRPAVSNSRHESGNAIDIGRDVVRELINRVTTETSDLQDYVNSPISNPPACNLQWGGRFRQYDWVHFQLP